MKKLPLLFLLFLAACAQNPATGNPYLSLASPEELAEGGDANAAQSLKAEGLYRPESDVSIYVNNLCNRIYAVTEAARDAVQCNMADDNSVNAFATPGYLFFYRGLLTYMSSEDELASVIGHEAGHLNARHAARGITRERISDLVIGGALAGLSENGSGVGEVVNAVGTGKQVQEIGLKAFSRSQEREADALGRRYMAKGGFDARQSVNAQRAMLMYDDYRKKQENAFGKLPQSFLERFKSSHPPSAERVAAALAETGEPPVVAPAEDLSRQRYMHAIDGLAYGPARRYGIARAGELVLPRQRVIIPLPAGTTTDYLSSGHPRNLGVWLIGHPQSGVGVSLTSLKLVTGHNPGSLVASMLPLLHTPVTRLEIGTDTPVATPTEQISSADLDDPEETTAEEDPTEPLAPNRKIIGYTATYHYLNTSQYFRVIAFGAATRKNEMIVMQVVYPDKTTMEREDTNIVSILQKARFLTRTQALKYQPLQLHTFTAATGETVANRAAKLPVGALQEDLFRAMNNLPQGTDLLPGQTYKTIVDLNN